MKKPVSITLFMVSMLIVSLVITAAAGAEENIGNTVVEQFIDKTGAWWGKLQGYAIFVLKITATLEIALFGIRMTIQKTQLNEIIAQFLMLILFIAFIAEVIMNYQQWASAIAITGLKDVVTDLGAGAPPFDAGSPVSMIFLCLDSMVPVLGDAGIRDIGMTMIYVFCMGAIAVVFAIICCRYILVVCEFYIVANAGVLLIGLGGSKLFKEYAFNAMKYVLAVGVKLFILQLVCNIGFSILSLQTEIGGMGTSIKNINMVTLMMIVVQGVILLGLSFSLPQTCAGLINGSNVDGGNPLMMLGGKVAKQGMSMLGGAGKSMAGGVQNLREARQNRKIAGQIADAEGVTGSANRRSHIQQTLDTAKMSLNPNTMQSQLTSRLNATKAMASLEDQSPSTSSDSGVRDMTRPLVGPPAPPSSSGSSLKDMTKPPKLN